MNENIAMAIGFSVAAIAFAIVGFFNHREKLRRIEIVRQERQIAMEKGLPLPEWPVLELPRERPRFQPSRHTLPFAGIILLAVSVGAMPILYFNPPPGTRASWLFPLPSALVGLGLLIYHWLPKKLD